MDRLDLRKKYNHNHWAFSELQSDAAKNKKWINTLLTFQQKKRVSLLPRLNTVLTSEPYKLGKNV